MTDRPYTHGFESIYAFETIDPSSVRVLNSAPRRQLPAKEESYLVEHPPAQPEFSFLKNSITPFFLKESLEILKLSTHAERFLRSMGLELVEELLTLDFTDLTLLRGLGQGNIEEIHTKCREFIRGRSCKERSVIDYLSWARSLFRGMDKRVLGVVFEQFGLSEHLPLTMTEKVEIKKLPPEKKREWVEQFKETCRLNAPPFKEDLKKVLEAFVRPWMLGRGGLASGDELRELAWRLGENEQEAVSVLQLFSELFCGGKHPFFDLESSIVPDLFVAHQESAKMVLRIVRVLRSYFYSPDLEYPLEELTAWMEREFACAWIDLDSRMVIKVIRQSEEFSILQPGACKRHIVRRVKSPQDHNN